MDAESAIEYIHSFYGKGEKRGLENMRELMACLGNPHERVSFVHVAGTNGKGSVCALIESALRAQGYLTGLYTSPYLEVYNERIRLNGEPISDAFLGDATQTVRAAVEWLLNKGACKPTEFEVGTAVAITAFEMAGADIAVMETGLGGRLDSTNIITPLVSVIARIGLDHTKLLGDTIEKIAFEKAGIIKPGVPVALYPQREEVRRVVADVCREKGAPLCAISETDFAYKVDKLGAHISYCGWRNVRVNLPGRHQALNSATALAALAALRGGGVNLDDNAVYEGFPLARWPGRLEWIDKRMLIDCAHNPQGAEALADYLQEFYPGRRAVLLTGMMRDKDAAGIVSHFSRFARRAVIMSPDSRRGADPVNVAKLFLGEGVPVDCAGSLDDALNTLWRVSGDDDLLVAAGSVYLAGAVRGALAAKR